MNRPDIAPPPTPVRAADPADQSLLMEAVREAGGVALSYFGKNPRSRTKPDGTEVSEADLAVDEALKRALLAARPDYGWLSEETEDDRRRLSRDAVWVVDPIDGTRAFLQERPEWTVAAALVVSGRPVLGVVHNPANSEFFHAAAGEGAWLNGQPLRVRDPVPLENSRLYISRSLPRHHIWTRPWPPVEACWVNSIAYRLALVAAGRADGTLSLSKKNDWDLAAAELLVQEAGGVATDHLGDAFRYNRTSPVQRSVVAAGPALHAEITERTREARI